MPNSIDAALSQLEAFVEHLDPEALTPEDSVDLLEKLCRAERICAAGKALVSLRVADSKAWHSSGHRSPAHLVAALSRSSVSQACRLLDTAHMLTELPEIECAFRQGALTEAQVVEMASAASLAPEFQSDLLEVAEMYSLHELRRQCAQLRATSGSESERQERIHKGRQLRHWTDIEGAFRMDGRLTPEAGAVVMAALEPFRQQVARRMSKDGPKDSLAAQQADALVEMAQKVRCIPEDAFRAFPSAMVQVRVDHTALERGHAVPGEVCEVPGVGPIPVAAARALIGDSLLTAVVAKGKDVVAVANLGRTVTAKQRIALWDRDGGCVIAGCNDRSSVEIDHVQEWRGGGRTQLDNLALLCSYHHYLKTHHGWQLKRAGDRWLFEAPGAPPDDDWESSA